MRLTRLSGFGKRRSAETPWIGYTWAAPTISTLTPAQCNIFVDGVSGSDSNNGLSEDRAKATVNGGRAAAVTHGTGAKIYVKAATYTETATSGTYGLAPATAIDWEWMFEDGAILNYTASQFTSTSTNSLTIHGYGVLNQLGGTTGMFRANGAGTQTIYCKSVSTNTDIVLWGSSTGLMYLYATEDIDASTTGGGFGAFYGVGGVLHCRDLNIDTSFIRSRTALYGNMDIIARNITGGSSSVNFGAFYTASTTGAYEIRVQAETLQGASGRGFMGRFNVANTAVIRLTGCDIKCESLTGYGAFYGANANNKFIFDNCRIRNKTGNTYNLFDDNESGVQIQLDFLNNCRLSSFPNADEFTVTGSYTTNAGTW